MSRHGSSETSRCPHLVIPGDVQPAAVAAASGEFAGVDPVVDDTGAAAELVGGFGDAYLAAGGGRWRGGQRAGSGSAAQAADWAISSWQRAWAWSFHGMGRALREIEVVRVN